MDKQDSLFLNIVNSFSPDIKPLPAIVIILEHCASIIDFVPSIKKGVYRITDERINDRTEWEKPERYPEIYMENINKAVQAGKRIILLDYNPATALMTQNFIELYEEDNAERVLCLSFFHDDEETYHTHIDGIEDLLDYKFHLIVSMIDYPYINKITIPFGFKISADYLFNLLHELMS